MKAAKVVRIALIVVIVFIVGLVVLVGLFGGKAMRVGIEVGATQALKVPVTVGGADLSIFGGSAGIQELVVANPAGYENNMLEMGNAKIDLQLGSVLSDTIKIEEILLEKVTVTLEQKGLTNNIQEVLDGMSKPTEEPEPEEEKEEEQAGKNLLIKKLRISEVAVKIKLLPGAADKTTLTMKLAPIEMEDLGSEDKMDIAVLSSKILLAIVNGIAKQGVGILPDEILGPMGDTLKNLGAAAEVLLKETGKVLEGGKEVTEKVLEDTKKVGDDLKKGLDDLFKKKEE